MNETPLRRATARTLTAAAMSILVVAVAALPSAEGGTAVLERFTHPGSGGPQTMLTVYHLDGDDLLLTHYCVAGNQPHEGRVVRRRRGALRLRRRHQPRLARDRPEQMQKIIEKYRAWGDGLRAAGRLIESNKLRDGEGRVLRRGNGKPRVLDGPYSETKEVVGGYFAVRAADYDEAVTLCEDGQLRIRGAAGPRPGRRGRARDRRPDVTHAPRRAPRAPGS